MKAEGKRKGKERKKERKKKKDINTMRRIQKLD